jgi:hypothetical protein
MMNIKQYFFKILIRWYIEIYLFFKYWDCDILDRPELAYQNPGH